MAFDKTISVALGTLVFLSAATSPAGAKDHGTKYDRDADFSGLETFGWDEARTVRPEQGRMAQGNDVDVMIREAIQKQLESQGFRFDADAADFLVTYDTALVPVTTVESERREITAGVSWVFDGTIQSYMEGTLVLTIYDAGTDKPIWSGWTEGKIKDPQNPEKQIKKVIKQLLGRFPP